MTMHVVAPVVGHAAAGSGPHLNGIFLTPQPYMPPRLPTIGSTTGFSRSDPASKKLAAATSDANASPTSVVLKRAPLTQRVAMATVCKTVQRPGAADPGEMPLCPPQRQLRTFDKASQNCRRSRRSSIGSSSRATRSITAISAATRKTFK